MVLTKEQLSLMIPRVTSVLEVFGILDQEEIKQVAKELNQFYKKFQN